MKRSFTKKLLDKIGIVLLGALVAPIITVLSSNTNEKIMKRSFTKKLLDKIGIVLLGALVAPIITVLYLALLFNEIRTYFYFKKALKKAKQKHQNGICESD